MLYSLFCFYSLISSNKKSKRFFKPINELGQIGCTCKYFKGKLFEENLAVLEDKRGNKDKSLLNDWTTGRNKRKSHDLISDKKRL